MAQGMIHTVPPNGALVEVSGEGVYVGRGDDAPSDGEEGFAPGALWFDTDATGVARVLMNVGSKASCDFDVLATLT